MEAPFWLKESFIAPFKVNPNILRANLSDPLEVFNLPQDFKQKYKDRIEELRLAKEMRLRQRTNPSETIRVKKANLEAKRISRNSTQIAEFQRIKLIQEMMNRCQGLTDFESAKFYLEAQEWDINKAINFYSECTGESSRVNHVTITFVLPNNNTFTSTFDPSQLMWSMLAPIYEKLPEKREFVVRTSERGQVIDMDRMTEKSFKDFGIGQSATMYVQYR